jgi:hypothetical protein
MAKAKKKKTKAKAKAKTKARPKRSSKKKTLKKKKINKKPAKKISKKKAKKKAKKRTAVKKKRPTASRAPAKGSEALKERKFEKLLHIEPGPPAGSIPPVEEPAQQEEAIGVVTHYYSHLGVAVVQVNKDALRTGDRIRIKGHTTDLTQTVGSLEYEHQHVDQASAGQSVGLKVIDHAREHDIVYVLR